MQPEIVLFLCRHGERADSTDPQWILTAKEPRDPPLSFEGGSRFKPRSRGLLNRSIEGVVASPLRRTVESAQIAAAILQVPFDIDDGLVEWQNPAWFSGLTTGNPHRWMKEALHWSGKRRRCQQLSFPETEQQAKARCFETARALIAELQRLLVIGHENGVAGIVSTLTNTRVDHVGVGEVLELTSASGWVTLIGQREMMSSRRSAMTPVVSQRSKLLCRARDLVSSMLSFSSSAAT